MSGDVVLGIDLGTTNSVVAVADGGQARVLSNELGERLIPSVVSFKGDGGVLIGEEARDRRLLDASNTIYSVKRLIGRPYRTPEVRRAQDRFAFDIAESPSGGVVVNVRGDSYTLTEISSFVLREIARIAERALGFNVARSVITVPASFNELQRSATKAAGRVAGLDVIRIINEPTAAALAYGYGKTKPERVAVYDLGGGTFDLTILELENDVFEVVSTAGDSFLGGDDLDVLVADMMSDAFLEEHRWDPRTDRQAYERLRAASEWAKCQLSSEQEVELTIEELHYGAGGKPLDLQFHLGRPELEKAVMPYIARSFDVCQDAFREAKMKPKDVDSVVLVGGSTRVPMVRQMVEEYFGMTARIEIDPDLVVAQGAAIHGYAIGGRALKKRPALGRVALKKISAADLKALKEKRAARQADLPNQPAFAPTAQVEQQRPAAIKPARPTNPPPAMPNLPSPRKVPPPRAPASFDDATTQVGASPDDDFSTLPSIDLDEQPTRIAPHPGNIPGVVTASAPIPVGVAAPDVDAELADYLGEEVTQARPAPPAPPAPPPRRASAKQTSMGMPRVDVMAAMAAVPPPAPTDQTGPMGTPPGPPQQPPPVPPDPQASPDSGFRPSFGLEGSDIFDPPSPLAADPGLQERPELAEPAQAPSANLGPAPIPVVELPERAPPLLMDVTPHSLGIETVGGYCQHLIRRNAPIPAEQSRIFSTGADEQELVAVRVCQGEERTFGQNQSLGEIILRGLRRAPRGEVQIDVAFILDANGTLNVRAIDVSTGREQSIEINLLGGASDEDIAAMQDRQARMMG